MFSLISHSYFSFFFFFFNDTATTEIYTLSLHDALPISAGAGAVMAIRSTSRGRIPEMDGLRALAIGAVMIEHFGNARSEEHTSELQSRPHLVCRLLLEKKKKKNKSS